MTSINFLIYVQLDKNRVKLMTLQHLACFDVRSVLKRQALREIDYKLVFILESPVSKAFDKDLERSLARVKSIVDGIDAALAGHTVPVSQMFNPLSLVASPKNPRSPAFAEPASLDFAKVVAKVSETSPLQGEQVFTAVGDMLQKLQELPDIGVDGKYPNTRELAFYDCPVTLVYTVDGDASVTVVAVFYTSETLS